MQIWKSKTPTGITFKDISQCFDSLWAEQTYIDLLKNGVQNVLNILHKINSNTEIKIKTPVGISEGAVNKKNHARGKFQQYSMYRHT